MIRDQAIVKPAFPKASFHALSTLPCSEQLWPQVYPQGLLQLNQHHQRILSLKAIKSLQSPRTCSIRGGEGACWPVLLISTTPFLYLITVTDMEQLPDPAKSSTAHFPLHRQAFSANIPSPLSLPSPTAFSILHLEKNEESSFSREDTVRHLDWLWEEGTLVESSRQQSFLSPGIVI